MAAAALGWAMPTDVVPLVSQELIALFGLLLAGALPTMILTATILRAGAFSPKRVGDYARALDAQLSFWFALFIWALLACVAVMLSKAFWNEGHQRFIDLPVLSIGAHRVDLPTVYFAHWSDALLGLAGAQVAYRLFPMLTGLRSLLRLNSAIATEEAAAKAKQDLTPGRVAAERVKPDEEHGAIIDG